MELTPDNLAERIRARGLPESVVVVAVDGGEALHPALDYRAESVWAPSWEVVSSSGDADLVPLWTCGTTTMFSRGDGSFAQWDAEVDAPSSVYPDFAHAVRALLTDLYEDEVDDDERREIATLLVPASDIEFVLEPEPR